MADAQELLTELSRVARRLGIEVRGRRFHGPVSHAGGMCWLKGRRVVLLNQASSVIERCAALAEALGPLDTESIVMSQGARQSISRTRYASNLSPRNMSAKPGIVSHRVSGESDRQVVDGPLRPEEHVDLGAQTTLQVGGRARFFLNATNETELADGLAWAEARNLPCLMLGGGSNLVISDEGVAGLVIGVALRGTHVIERKGSVELSVQAGEPWDALVARTVQAGWQGLECLSGIPGRVGATPIQNVGAYGQEVSDVVQSVRVIDRTTRRVLTLKPKDCRFAYRDSLFKSTEPERFVVTAVTYRLHKRGAPAIAYAELARALEPHGKKISLDSVRACVLGLRREKAMLLDASDVNTRSCGSFFLNPIVSTGVADQIDARSLDERQGPRLPRFAQANGTVKLPAAWLIERAGFRKGERFGNAGISDRHALAVVAHGQASARDIVGLARNIRNRVLERFGVELKPEPAFWGFGRPESHELPEIARD